jgi:DNA-binding beta-propeller fold protein YncE
LYVTSGVAAVYVIDGSTNQIIGKIVEDIVGGPVGVAFDSVNGDTYVAILPISLDDPSKEPRTLKADNRELYNIIKT